MTTAIVNLFVESRKAFVAFVVPFIVAGIAQVLPGVNLDSTTVTVAVVAVINALAVYVVRNGPKPVADIAQRVINEDD